MPCRPGAARRWLGWCLLGLLAAVCPARAFDWAKWLNETVKDSYRLRLAVLNDNKSDREKALAAELDKSAAASEPIPMEKLLAVEPRAEGMAFVLGDAKFPINIKKIDPKKYQSARAAVGYSFSLNAPAPFILKVMVPATAVFHNGRRLNYAGGEMWSNNPVYEINGDAGLNTIVILPHGGMREMPKIQVFPGETLKRTQEAVKKVYASGLTPEQTGKIAGYLTMYAEDSVVSGERLAEALLDWADAIDRNFPKEKQTEQRNLLLNTTANIIKKCWMGQNYVVFEKLYRSQPGWFGAPLFYRMINPAYKCEEFDVQLVHAVAPIAIRRGGGEIVENLFADLGKIMNHPPKNNDLHKRNWYSLADTARAIAVGACARENACDLGVRLLEMRMRWDREIRKIPENTKERHRDNYVQLTNDKEKLEWQMRVVSRLEPDVEAEQLYDEMQTKITELKEPTPESVSAFYRLFRQHGLSLKKSENGLCAMRLEIISLLRKNKFLDSLIKEAENRLGPDIDRAEKNGELKTLTAILSNFAGLLPMERVHKILLHEYYDRGEWQKAHYHANYLATVAPDTATKAVGAAYLLELEKLMNLPEAQRFAMPDTLADAEVSFKGAKKRLSRLREEISGKGRKNAVAEAAPGRYLGTLDIGVQDCLETYGSKDFFNRNNDFNWQPVEPLVSGDAVYASTPFRTWCWREDGKGWTFTNPHFLPDFTYRNSVASFNGCSDNGNVLFLANGGGGQGIGLCAYSADGRLLWDTSQSPGNGVWEALSAPVSAFGRMFVLIGQRQTSNTQIAVAEVDGRTGVFRNIITVQNIDIPLYVLRFGNRLVSDATGIYGITGVGTMFGINADSMTITWISYIASGRGDAAAQSSPGFVSILGDSVLTYYPPTHEVIAVRKNSGVIAWRGDFPQMRFLHSLGSDKYLVFSAAEPERGMLTSLNPRTGKPRWSVATAGIRITGEGAVVGDSVYVPCENGIGVFALSNGKLTDFLPMREMPLKVRYAAGKWAVATARRMHMFAAEGAFEAAKIPAAATAAVTAEPPAPAAEGLADAFSLRLADALPYPCSDRYRNNRKEWINTVVRLPDNYFAMYRDDVLGVYREGQYNADGVYAPSRVVSMGYYPNLRVAGRFFATFRPGVAEFYSLPERRLCFRYQIPEKNGTPSDDHVIQHVAVTAAGQAAIALRNGRFVVADLAAGRIVNIFPVGGEVRDVWGMTKDLLVFRDSGNSLCVVNPLNGKDLRRTKEKFHHPGQVRVSPHFLPDGSQTLCVFTVDQGAKKLRLLDLKTAAFSTEIGGLRNPNSVWYGLRVGDKMAVPGGQSWQPNGGQILDCAQKKPVHDNVPYQLVAFGDGNIVYAQVSAAGKQRKVDNFVLCTPQKEIKLEMPEGMFDEGSVEWIVKEFQHKSFQLAAKQHGNRIYLLLNGSLLVYDANGKFINRMYITGDSPDCRVSFLRHSLLLHAGGRCAYVINGTDKVPAAAAAQYISTPGGDSRWPAEGWTPLQPVNDWKLAPGMAKPQGYAYRLGAGDGKLFFEFAAGAPAGGVQAAVKVMGYQEDNVVYEYRLPMDTLEPAAAAPRALTDKIESWCETGDDGKRHFYVVLDKSAYPEREDYAAMPRTHLQFSLTRHGAEVARAEVAGVADRWALRYLPQPVDRFTCQSESNFKMRETLYGTAAITVPQGRDLLEWLTNRRLAKGGRDNLEFLDGMLKRNAALPAAANVLSAMLIEHMRLFTAENPQLRLAGAEYRQRLLAVCQELKKKADALQVPAAYSDRALTVLSGSSSGWVPATWLNLLGGKDGKQTIRKYNFHYKDQQTWYAGRYPLNLITFGVFEGDALPASGIRQLSFECREPWRRLHLCGWHVISPAGDVAVLTDDGQAAPNVKVEKLPNGNRELLDAPGKFWRLKVLPGVVISFPEIKFAEAPKEKKPVSPRDLQLALENLPSDSTIGPSLALMYLNATANNPDVKDALTPEQVWLTLLKRVGSNISQRDSVMWKLRDIYLKEICDRDRIDSRQTDKVRSAGYSNASEIGTKLSAAMKDAGLSKNYQKNFLLRCVNYFYREQTWMLLGPFGVPDDQEEAAETADDGNNKKGESEALFAPLPEKQDKTDAAEYVFNKGAKKKFELVKTLERRLGAVDKKRDNVAYMQCTLTLDSNRKEQKIYLHFRNCNIQGWQWERANRLTLWQRAEEAGSPSGYGVWEKVDTLEMRGGSPEIYSIQMKIVPGKNQLLIKSEYRDDGTFDFGVGNVNGVPYKNVTVTK